MTPLVDIIVPTWRRHDRLAQVAADAHAGTPQPHVVTFVVEPDDTPSWQVASDLAAHDPQVRAVLNRRAASYAGAANTAVASSDAPWWFAGADDLRFHPGWLDAALAVADDQFMVIGTNDLLNPYVRSGLHATHYLVDRRYTDTMGGTLDQGPGVAFWEGYHHQWTDTEFIGVAKARVRFRPCLESIVEHRHFTVGKSKRDETYDRAYAELAADRERYRERKQAWDNLVA